MTSSQRAPLTLRVLPPSPEWLRMVNRPSTPRAVSSTATTKVRTGGSPVASTKRGVRSRTCATNASSSGQLGGARYSRSEDSTPSAAVEPSDWARARPGGTGAGACDEAGDPARPSRRRPRRTPDAHAHRREQECAPPGRVTSRPRPADGDALVDGVDFTPSSRGTGSNRSRSLRRQLPMSLKSYPHLTAPIDHPPGPSQDHGDGSQMAHCAAHWAQAELCNER